MAVREPSSLDSSKRSVPDRFESFDLSIERVGETYRVKLTGSPDGPRQSVSIDPAGLQADELSPSARGKTTRDVERRPVGRSDLQRLGARLFQTVFVEGIVEAFRTSVERARNQGAGLRVCLRLDEAPELAVLPWEALWDPKDRAFLADQPDLPVVRALGVPAEEPVVRPARVPLRVLALLPEPRGEGKLSGASEWQQIRQHLALLVERGEVEANRVEPPTLDALGRRIDQGPCHVLHIVAHGGPGDAGAGGQLKLEDAAGKPDPVSGGDLARALERRAAPRLVVLSACHGARAAVDDAFDGMAQHLLNRGIPAVVGMRTVVSDAAAVSFSAALYQELAKGRSVERAMVEARRTLSLGKDRAEWATPVLYLQGENVRILDITSSDRSAPARRAARGRFRGAALLAAAIAAAGLLGFWVLRSRVEQAPTATEVPSAAEVSTEPLGFVKVGPESCPPPLGLEDHHFVKVEPDIINLGGRKVIVEEAFCIDTKEISRRDWLAVMGGVLPRSEWPLDWPMTRVTVEDIEVFLERLEARVPGVSYRLPTADEWELAARADQETKYFFGDDPSELHKFGNCKNLMHNDGHDGPAPVGSYQPNSWGLYDVHGNVAEWVQWPEDADPAEDENGKPLAMRLGGSHGSTPGYCAFGNRRGVIAAKKTRDDTGFRVVREVALGRDG